MLARIGSRHLLAHPRAVFRQGVEARRLRPRSTCRWTPARSTPQRPVRIRDAVTIRSPAGRGHPGLLQQEADELTYRCCKSPQTSATPVKQAYEIGAKDLVYIPCTAALEGRIEKGKLSRAPTSVLRYWATHRLAGSTKVPAPSGFRTFPFEATATSAAHKRAVKEIMSLSLFARNPGHRRLIAFGVMLSRCPLRRHPSPDRLLDTRAEARRCASLSA